MVPDTSQILRIVLLLFIVVKKQEFYLEKWNHFCLMEQSQCSFLIFGPIFA